MPKAKTFLKSMISGLPGPLAIAAWDAIWSLKSPAFREQRRRQRAMYRRLGRPDRILGGPFAGMRYIRRATGSAYLPKLVGTYEMEVVPVLAEIFRHPPDLIIDIGAAEGYYAVGLALRLPQARVIAYDIYKPARYLLQTLAYLNSVTSRIDIRCACDADALQTDLRLSSNPMVICDCEGFEDELLRPNASSELRRTRVLVEIHECFRPGVGERVRQRFEPTHEIEAFRTCSRAASMLPPELNLVGEEAVEAMNEYRSGVMEWLFMQPRRA